MTGWPVGIESLYTCSEYEESDGLMAEITPGLCSHWIGCTCELDRECPWSGLPPLESDEKA